MVEEKKDFSFNKLEWELLKDFIEDKLESYPLSSKKRYFYNLNRFGKFIGYNDDFLKSDVLAYFHTTYFEMLSIYTQNGIKTCLRQFLKWLLRDYQYIKNKRLKTQEKKLSEFPTWDDIKNIVVKLTKSRDKALFMLLLEAAGTTTEVRELNIGDIIFKGNTASVFFKQSHLAQRTIPLIESTPFLIKYLETHPFKNDPLGPLFLSLYHGKMRRISRGGLYFIIKKNTKGLQKSIYPDLLRRMRLRQLSRIVMPPVLERLAGWKQGSEMTLRYYRATDMELEEIVLELYGINNSLEKTDFRILGIRVCPVCQFVNSGIDSFCIKCTSHLESEIEQQEEV